MEVRSILTGEFGFARPIGLAYIRKKNVLLVAKAGHNRTQLLRLGPFEDALGKLTLPKLSSPSTLSFDPAGAHLVAISGKELITVRSSYLGERKPPVGRVDISYLRLRNPQGATFDPTDRTWLILDSGTQAIVRVPASGRGPPTPARISVQELRARTLRGLAFNPADRLLYVADPDRALLYGLDRSGRVRKIYSIRNAALRKLTGLVFAPSADPTDSPTIHHLYAADAGGPSALGRVVELSLAPAVSLPVTVTGTLVQTIQTSKFDPPAPDPSGITYVAATDTLLITDSEVDEMPIYRAANLFWTTRTGILVDTGVTVPTSREPTGVGFGSGNGALCISDDDKHKVFIFRPGPDGRYGTADDSMTSMSTASFGSLDPEGVEFDPNSGHLFLADGLGTEIYDVDPVNGAFADGDDRVTHFDVEKYGIRNVEGIGNDTQRDTLLVVADQERRIFELTKAGALVRIINLSTIPRRLWLSSVTVAPTSNPSDSSSAMNYWVTDRQLDNNAHPDENDGKVYEVSLP